MLSKTALGPFANMLSSRRLRAAALAVAVAGPLLLAAAPAAAETKIAVVDMRRAIAETEQGLRVQATMRKLFDGHQASIESQQRKLQADKEALEKEAQIGKTSKEVIQKKAEGLQRQFAEFQNAVVESEREMQRKQGEMTYPIEQGIRDAVKRIAAQDGFEMVLEKSAVPYFRGDLEVTDRAIQMFNSGAGGGAAPSGKGAPAAPAGKGAPAATPAPASPAPAAPGKPPAKK
jgi:outer membrane protein